MGLATQMGWRATADDPFANPSGRQEVGFQLDGAERSSLGDVGATPHGRARIGKCDDRGGEQEPSGSDEVVGHVDVRGHQVGRATEAV